MEDAGGFVTDSRKEHSVLMSTFVQELFGGCYT